MRNERGIAPDTWGAFAQEISSLTGNDVSRELAETEIKYWRLIRTASHVDKNLPVTIEVTGPSPVGYWKTTITYPATTWARWHGYRYMILGAVVPPDYVFPPGSPYWRLYDQQGGLCKEQLLLVGQYAAAEGCNTFAKGIWNPDARKMMWSTHTLGDEPPSRRDAKLANQAQLLIAAEVRRGRPLEVPIDALARLNKAQGTLRRGIEPGRINLSCQTGLTEWGVDKLRQRAGISRTDEISKFAEFSTKPRLQGSVE
jgi:hypothetical protein